METKKKEMQCCVDSCDSPLDQNFWNEHWAKGETGWDIGQASPAITEYLKKYRNKKAAILIPGCGNAYEAEWMLANGFTNITLVDIAPKAVEKLKGKFADAPEVKVLQEDFFDHRGSYDLIVEQTFFCALPPHRRDEYAKKMSGLLRDNGKLIGLLFDKKFDHAGPPFGGCPCEYKPVFGPFFDIRLMEKCYNSIPPRDGSELFIVFVKK